MGRVATKIETTKLLINMPVDLLGQLDDYANRMCINRTSAICVLLNQALNNEKAITDIGELVRVFREEQKRQSIEG